MTLLSISLLALLLLPLSLSCDSIKPLTDVVENYKAIVQTNIENARESIAALLKNSSCPELKHKPHNCTSKRVNERSILHNLACKMESLGVSHTRGLATSVKYSIGCPCPGKPTKEPDAMSKRRTVTRKRRNAEKIRRKETRRLCRANAILFAMTECYEILSNE